MSARALGVALLMAGCNPEIQPSSDHGQAVDYVEAAVKDLEDTKKFQRVACRDLDLIDSSLRGVQAGAKERTVRCLSLVANSQPGVADMEYSLWTRGDNEAGFVRATQLEGSAHPQVLEVPVSPYELMRFAIAKDVSCGTSRRISIQGIDCEDTMGL